jgi:chromosomal replication initiation ATPase DnaA
MSQFTLPLAWRSADGEADFFVSGSNERAVAKLERWPDWPSRTLILTGDRGSGKSHLARIFTRRVGGAITLFDDADRQPRDEHAMFHAWNAAQAGGPGLLLVGRAPPAGWEIALPDLRSRLMAAPLASIDAPDDPLLGEIISKHFRDRGLLVQPPVIAYMVSRIERSFAAALRAVSIVDSAAMAARRGVTIPLVRAALGFDAEDEGEGLER